MDQDVTVLFKVFIRAAAPRPMLRDRLAHILGSAPAISRLSAGKWQLVCGGEDGERALLPVRVYRALDSIAGGDDVAKTRLKFDNRAMLGRLAGTIETTGEKDPCLPQSGRFSRRASRAQTWPVPTCPRPWRGMVRGEW
jgi:hypothetical protein